MSGETGLPADFPQIDGVVWVKSSTAGPSKVVDGYTNHGLDDVYNGVVDGFNSAGYSILFKEKEDKDAEISYEGGGTTGQIALRDVCGEGDKLVVHITNRPK